MKSIRIRLQPGDDSRYFTVIQMSPDVFVTSFFDENGSSYQLTPHSSLKNVLDEMIEVTNYEVKKARVRRPEFKVVPDVVAQLIAGDETGDLITVTDPTDGVMILNDECVELLGDAIQSREDGDDYWVETIYEILTILYGGFQIGKAYLTPTVANIVLLHDEEIGELLDSDFMSEEDEMKYAEVLLNEFVEAANK